MYEDRYQAERLLRAIYRPQNIYCIHVDSKATRDMKDAVASIASCFENVLIASQLYDVQWGTLSVPEAELSCIRDLLHKHKSWKYFINLTGQKFPLRTKYELAKILITYNGANDIMGGKERFHLPSIGTTESEHQMYRKRFWCYRVAIVVSLLFVHCGVYIYLFSTASFRLHKLNELNESQIKSLVSCRKLFDGDSTEMKKTYTLMEIFKPKPISDTEYINMTKSCDSFLEKRGYIMSSLTSVEEAFPLAFSIVMYKDLYQAERLLRAIYRPQNIYCIHVDSKATRDMKDAVTSIVSCFENVFIASQLYDVQWGTLSVLDAELSCIRDLLHKHKSWKYFINLTGQEFPLRTNYELVKILSTYDGANDIMGGKESEWHQRWEHAGTPPHNIRPFKGDVHIVANRDFVHFLVNNDVAQDVYTWAKNTTIPDEIFFNTMNHNPQLGIRGQYNGSKAPHEIRYFSRIKIWTDSLGAHCHGKVVRDICIFGIGDLPQLMTKDEFVFNKFHWDFQSFTLDCMEELYFNTTRDEYLGIKDFNTSVYETADIVKYTLK